MKLPRVLVPVFLLYCLLIVPGVRTMQAEDGNDFPIRLYVREVPLTVLGKQVKVLVIEQDSGVQGFEPQTSSGFNVEVINQLREPTSIHWHGILLPPLMDGVPYVSQDPIPPNGKMAYKLPPQTERHVLDALALRPAGTDAEFCSADPPERRTKGQSR